MFSGNRRRRVLGADGCRSHFLPTASNADREITGPAPSFYLSYRKPIDTAATTGLLTLTLLSFFSFHIPHIENSKSRCLKFHLLKRNCKMTRNQNQCPLCRCLQSSKQKSNHFLLFCLGIPHRCTCIMHLSSPRIRIRTDPCCLLCACAFRNNVSCSSSSSSKV